MTLEEELVAAKKEADAAKKKYDALVLKAKKNHEDGIVPVGDMALVLFSQERLSTEKFEAQYPYTTYSQMYKMVPDTEAVRNELSGKEFTAVANSIRVLTVKTLAKAQEDEESFKKD